MFDCTRLGAIDCETNRYVPPSRAVKGRQYRCIDCEQAVIFKHGKIRKPHYAHKSKTNCTHFEHCNESALHKEAKFALMQHLNDGLHINIAYHCISCREPINKIVKCHVGQQVVCEYVAQDNCRYDVCIVDHNNMPVCVIEVMYTHRTTSKRPEPWYELYATNILEYIWDFDASEHVKCMRYRRNDVCYDCNKQRILQNSPELRAISDEKHTDCLICGNYENLYTLNDNRYVAMCCNCIDEYDPNTLVALAKKLLGKFNEYHENLRLEAEKQREKLRLEEEKRREEQCLQFNTRRKELCLHHMIHTPKRLANAALRRDIMSYLKGKKDEWNKLTTSISCVCGDKFPEKIFMSWHIMKCKVYQKPVGERIKVEEVQNSKHKSNNMKNENDLLDVCLTVEETSNKSQGMRKVNDVVNVVNLLN
jgi:hypothetical protein